MHLQPIVHKAKQFLIRDVWLMNIDDPAFHRWQRRGIWLARMLYLTFLRFREERCTIRASSLTTVTIISVVPVLAFAFSIAKGFGAYQTIQNDIIVPSLNQWLGSENAPELRTAVDQVFTFVESTDLSKLGVLGFITIAYAVIRLLSSVEASFNDLWQVRSARSITRKLADYLSVVIIVPLVLLVAATVSAALRSGTTIAYLQAILEWGHVGAWGLRIVVLPMVWLGFAVVYRFMPNTVVSFRAAAVGGVCGGTLWLLIHTAHVHLQVGVANYNAIYAGFSAFPIFVIWVFASWVAVLVGASFASATGTKNEFRRQIIRNNLLHRQREWLSLRLTMLLAQCFLADKGSVSIKAIRKKLAVSETALRVVIADLQSANFIDETRRDGVLLSRSPERIRVMDIVESLKGEKPAIFKEVAAEGMLKTKKSILATLQQDGRFTVPEATEKSQEEVQQIALNQLKNAGLIKPESDGTFLPTEAVQSHWALNGLYHDIAEAQFNLPLSQLAERSTLDISDM